jgi:prepilin-type processing-associated H-X9-DG protein
MAQCMNNLKQLGIAAQAYESTNGVFPPCVEDVDPTVNGSGQSTEADWSWLALILPQLEQQAIYDTLQVGVTPLETMIVTPSTNPDLVPIAHQPIPLFLCPTYGMPTMTNDGNIDRFKISSPPPVVNKPFAPAHYAANFGVGINIGWANPMNANNRGGAMPGGWGQPAARITDGLSNTFMAGEIARRFDRADNHHVKWLGCHSTPGNAANCFRNARTASYPLNAVDTTFRYGFGSAHAGGGAQFLFCDGSTRMIDDTVEYGSTTVLANYGIYQKLAHARDGQPISEY